MPTYLEEPKVGPCADAAPGYRGGPRPLTSAATSTLAKARTRTGFGERVGIYFPRNDIFYDPRNAPPPISSNS
jgi:hypothetical protein